MNLLHLFKLWRKISNMHLYRYLIRIPDPSGDSEIGLTLKVNLLYFIAQLVM